MCWDSFIRRDTVVLPINWLRFVHLVHSIRYITFLVEQEEYLWVGNVLLLLVEVTLHFVEMAEQHLQPGVPQGAELPSPGLVVLISIGSFNMGGFGYCFSLALTSFLAMLSCLVRQRHGLGTLSFSWSLGCMIFLSAFVSRFGV